MFSQKLFVLADRIDFLAMTKAQLAFIAVYCLLMKSCGRTSVTAAPELHSVKPTTSIVFPSKQHNFDQKTQVCDELIYSWSFVACGKLLV